mmetsp:Transcript_136030/g.422651  ORF Transcript_136030/g.422651 Transcript_136030/m.422651 type:complete len:766 (-) Transcript_136030:1918-4215(-)
MDHHRRHLREGVVGHALAQRLAQHTDHAKLWALRLAVRPPGAEPELRAILGAACVPAEQDLERHASIGLRDLVPEVPIDRVEQQLVAVQTCCRLGSIAARTVQHAAQRVAAVGLQEGVLGVPPQQLQQGLHGIVACSLVGDGLPAHQQPSEGPTSVQPDERGRARSRTHEAEHLAGVHGPPEELDLHPVAGQELVALAYGPRSERADDAVLKCAGVPPLELAHAPPQEREGAVQAAGKATDLGPGCGGEHGKRQLRLPATARPPPRGPPGGLRENGAHDVIPLEGHGHQLFLLEATTPLRQAQGHLHAPLAAAVVASQARAACKVELRPGFAIDDNPPRRLEARLRRQQGLRCALQAPAAGPPRRTAHVHAAVERIQLHEAPLDAAQAEEAPLLHRRKVLGEVHELLELAGDLLQDAGLALVLAIAAYALNQALEEARKAAEAVHEGLLKELLDPRVELQHALPREAPLRGQGNGGVVGDEESDDALEVHGCKLVVPLRGRVEGVLADGHLQRRRGLLRAPEALVQPVRPMRQVGAIEPEIRVGLVLKKQGHNIQVAPRDGGHERLGLDADACDVALLRGEVGARALLDEQPCRLDIAVPASDAHQGLALADVIDAPADSRSLLRVEEREQQEVRAVLPHVEEEPVHGLMPQGQLLLLERALVAAAEESPDGVIDLLLIHDEGGLEFEVRGPAPPFWDECKALGRADIVQVAVAREAVETGLEASAVHLVHFEVGVLLPLRISLQVVQAVNAHVEGTLPCLEVLI